MSSQYPRVLGEAATVEAALTGMSLSRFGDGELRLAIGSSAISQRETSPALQAELRKILLNPRTRCLVCLPNIDKRSPKFKFWAPYREVRYLSLFPEVEPMTYGSAFITRPDSAPWIDNALYWKGVRRLWADKEVCLVRGDDKSLTPDLMQDAKSIREVSVPRVNAYKDIDAIEKEIGQTDETVIMCAGVTATCLAYRLTEKGMHALDLGHLGMFMRHAGAYSVKPDQLTSDEYRKQLVTKHKGMQWGKHGYSHADEIAAYAKKLGAETILDYGCGTGTLAARMKEMTPPYKVQEYDPGIPGKDHLPKPADLIACTDVLEHIEPDKLMSVLRHIHSLCGKGAFFIISMRPAREILPDGRNAHLIVQEGPWWLRHLEAAGFIIEKSEKVKGLNVYARV